MTDKKPDDKPKTSPTYERAVAAARAKKAIDDHIGNPLRAVENPPKFYRGARVKS